MHITAYDQSSCSGEASAAPRRQAREDKQGAAKSSGGLLFRVLLAGACFAAAMLGAIPAFAQECAPGVPQVIVYHAGSLTAAFKPIEKLFSEQTGICVVDVSSGSVDAARRITTGGEPCDIYASADYKDIDVFLKPGGYASYTLVFARGAMVLAYTTASKHAALITAPGAVFAPPDAVPDAAPEWYTALTRPDVRIGGSHPFLDPGGYRADMIFQLIERHYGVANLYNTLLQHHSVNKSSDALGKTYDYGFTYEHSALAAFRADRTGTYRYVRLPEAIGLSDSRRDVFYGSAAVTMPGVQPGLRNRATVPATRVAWGATILNTAPNRENALRFLQLLFSSAGVALQAATGPEPISPPSVSQRDYGRLPRQLRPLVTVKAMNAVRAE